MLYVAIASHAVSRSIHKSIQSRQTSKVFTPVNVLLCVCLCVCEFTSQVLGVSLNRMSKRVAVCTSHLRAQCRTN